MSRSTGHMMKQTALYAGLALLPCLALAAENSVKPVPGPILPSQAVVATSPTTTPANPRTWSLPEMPACPAIEDRLRVGTRLTLFRLLDDKRDSFLGSINELDPIQDWMPFKLYAQWMFHTNWGVEVMWDRVEAATSTYEDGAYHNDGEIILKGPLISVFHEKFIRIFGYEWPRSINLTFGAGLAWLFGDFDHTDWWHNGFQGASPEYWDWVQAGRPPWPNGGYRRTMDIHDSIGWFATAGCSSPIGCGFSVELYTRLMYARAKDTYTLSYMGETHQVREATFPLHHLAAGIGIRYDW